VAVSKQFRGSFSNIINVKDPPDTPAFESKPKASLLSALNKRDFDQSKEELPKKKIALNSQKTNKTKSTIDNYRKEQIKE
jgi:hypothetical protein